MRTFTSYQKEFATLSGNASTTSNTTNSLDNMTWGLRAINDGIRYLATMFYFNETSFVVPGGTIAQTMDYPLPSDFESLINVTVQVGGLLWQGKESPTRKHFDLLNVVPYYNDFPQYVYIWNNRLNIWPIPASSSNVITINYKKRLTDISMDDVTETTASKTVAITTNTTTITASGSAFKNWMGMSGWIRVPYNTTDAANGDNKWYQVASVTSATALELKNKYSGPTLTGGSFTVGDVPVLPEDYQDLPLYRALMIYYSTKVLDTAKAKNFSSLYSDGYALLDNKYGSKSNSPVLNDPDGPIFNPNLFQRSIG